jgi:hypothetical protein
MKIDMKKKPFANAVRRCIFRDGDEGLVKGRIARSAAASAGESARGRMQGISIVL